MSTHIKADDGLVIMRLGDREARMPAAKARQLARALQAYAEVADEQAEHANIIADGALLLRIGFPMGLTDNPALQAEIVKEAQHSPELRRYLPGGIQSTELVGKPMIRQGGKNG